MIKQFIFISAIAMLIGSCNTNPPSTPDVTPTGNISLRIRVDDSISFLPNKVVVLESFTNMGCFPCAVTNRIIRQLSNETYERGKLVAIKFSVNFPSPYDLFYLAAKDICDFRIDYYNVPYAPTIIVDGILKPTTSDSMDIKTAIDSRLTAPPKFTVNVNISLEGDLVVDIAIRSNDLSGINISDLIINIAITETEIEFQQSPGSSGETKFYDVIRLMLPSKNGISLSQLITQGNLSFEFKDAILSVWNTSKLNAIVYIQDSGTKEVYQTASSFR